MLKRLTILIALTVAASACKQEQSAPAETTAAVAEAPDASAAPDAATEKAPSVAAPSALEVEERPRPETAPEISPEVLSLLCEGSDNVDTTGEFPKCTECPFAAKTRYNTEWEMYYAFEGSFSSKRAKELFVSGPGCYDAEGNHAAALVKLDGKKPSMLGAIRSTQADQCQSFDWFGRNAVACISDYQQRGQIRKIVTFFEVLDNKLKDLRMLDLPYKDGSCNFEGIYRRDLQSFDAKAEGSGTNRIVNVVLTFDAKVGKRKSGSPGDCMAIANGEVEVTSLPEVYNIEITTESGSTITRKLGDDEPVELDVDSSGKPKDPTYDLNRSK